MINGTLLMNWHKLQLIKPIQCRERVKNPTISAEWYLHQRALSTRPFSWCNQSEESSSGGQCSGLAQSSQPVWKQNITNFIHKK